MKNIIVEIITYSAEEEYHIFFGVTKDSIFFKKERAIEYAKRQAKKFNGTRKIIMDGKVR